MQVKSSSDESVFVVGVARQSTFQPTEVSLQLRE